jgi:hypothetical protein
MYHNYIKKIHIICTDKKKSNDNQSYANFMRF